MLPAVKLACLTLGLILCGSAHASSPLSAQDAQHVIEYGGRFQDGTAIPTKYTSLGEVFSGESDQPRVAGLTRAIRAILLYSGEHNNQRLTPLQRIYSIYADKQTGMLAAFLSTGGTRTSSIASEELGMVYLFPSGKVRTLDFEIAKATPEFQISPTEENPQVRMHQIFVTFCNMLEIQYANPQTAVLRPKTPINGEMDAVHREPLSDLIYGTGNSVTARFSQRSTARERAINDAYALESLRFSYAKPYIAPTQPIPNVEIQRQRALQVLRDRFTGIEDVILMPFAPELSGIPSEEQRDSRMNRPLSARHQNIRAQNLSIVTNVVRAFVIHSSNPAALGQWGMVFDSQTGELLEFRRLNDGPGGPLKSIDTAKPMNLDGKEVKLEWRKSFLFPSGQPHTLTQGNHIRTVFWNDTYQLWMMREGDHSLVARRP